MTYLRHVPLKTMLSSGHLRLLVIAGKERCSAIYIANMNAIVAAWVSISSSRVFWVEVTILPVPPYIVQCNAVYRRWGCYGATDINNTNTIAAVRVSVPAGTVLWCRNSVVCGAISIPHLYHRSLSFDASASISLLPVGMNEWHTKYDINHFHELFAKFE